MRGKELERRNPWSRGRGFSLIEVLVAVLVFSLGILGFISLQVKSIQAGQVAYYRSQATTLASDIIERIRANSSVAANYAGTDTNVAGGCDISSASGCSPSDMVSADLHSWQALLSNSLPSGLGIVCLDSTPYDGTPTAPACDGVGGSYVAKIWWDENKSGNTSTYQLFATPFSL